ncbi:hypothetical protein GGR54DRAFT_457397 [Hypoxylon sp. NC1633]|nr:hypothetical protein GGR54DRAFT_457397 [Hypoxylon sp. NC1633]
MWRMRFCAVKKRRLPILHSLIWLDMIEGLLMEAMDGWPPGQMGFDRLSDTNIKNIDFPGRYRISPSLMMHEPDQHVHLAIGLLSIEFFFFLISNKHLSSAIEQLHGFQFCINGSFSKGSRCVRLRLIAKQVSKATGFWRMW